MPMSPSPVLPRLRAGRASQRGAAAIEFAMVCSVFFMMLYFIVSYGAVFIVQQSLSRAAAEGARALLASEFAAVGATTVVTPEQLGRDAAARAVAWLSAFRQTRAQAPIAPQVAAASGCTVDMACRTVTVSYPDYSAYPLVPSLLPAGMMPRTLSASATVQLDKAQWRRAGGSP